MISIPSLKKIRHKMCIKEAFQIFMKNNWPKSKKNLLGAITTKPRNIPANFHEDPIKTEGGVSLYNIIPSKRIVKYSCIQYEH